MRRRARNALVSRKAFALVLALTVPTLGAADDSLWVDGSKASAPAELNLPSFAPVVDKLGRAVVNISIEGKESATPQRPQMMPGNPGGENPMSPFDYFFPVRKCLKMTMTETQVRLIY